MSCLGLDIGARRIGVAVSDAADLMALPLTTLETGAGGQLPLGRLRELVAERGVETIVVGLPLRLDGRSGPEAHGAEAAAEELRAALGVAVVLWDERLTSAEAERLLIEAGMSRRRRKGATDRIAAALILQGYLDRQRGEHGARQPA
ncbi:MAG TPA: Holliday junction resolvase RuvX [Acidobacteriota bacterium]